MNSEKDKQLSVPYQLPEGALAHIQAKVRREVELREKKHSTVRRMLWTGVLLAAASVTGFVFLTDSAQTEKMKETHPMMASIPTQVSPSSTVTTQETPAKETLAKAPREKKAKVHKATQTQTGRDNEVVATSAQMLTCDEEIEEGSDTEDEDLLLASADPFFALDDFKNE